MSNTFATGRGVSFHEMNRLTDAMAGKFMFPEAAGGAVTPSSGLTVAVAAITVSMVTINGAVVGTGYAGGTVTAGAADATNPRRDIVYYDTSGSVGIAAGTAAATPFVPTLTSSQIAVAELYVAAAVTTINAGDIYDRRQQVTGAKRTTGGGYFIIPAGPADGTSVAQSASADTYGSWVEMVASTSAAIFVVGLMVEPIQGTVASQRYVQVDIGTGAGGAESSIGEAKFVQVGVIAGGGAGPWSATVPPVIFPAPIPVAASTRIACRTASDEANANAHLVSLICINQSDLVTY